MINQIIESTVKNRDMFKVPRATIDRRIAIMFADRQARNQFSGAS